MKIIDAQVHIWSKTVVPPSGLHRKVERFTAEELLKEMERRFPGFRDDEVIRAMGTTSNAIFVVWERASSEGTS